MSFEDWLYRKAEQNAQNEILAFLIMILGMNLLIGGLIVTVLAVGEPLFLPFLAQQPVDRAATVGFVLTFAGFFMLSAGFVLAIHYDRQRSWYVGETAKSTMYEKDTTAIRTVNETVRELIEEKKKKR